MTDAEHEEVLEALSQWRKRQFHLIVEDQVADILDAIPGEQLREALFKLGHLPAEDVELLVHRAAAIGPDVSIQELDLQELKAEVAEARERKRAATRAGERDLQKRLQREAWKRDRRRHRRR